jgi:NADH dehydrogenase FAD-containing subunit
LGAGCSEQTCLQTPEEERKKLLSFVICGGGPTGVEVAAEIHDFVYNDLKVSCLMFINVYLTPLPKNMYNQLTVGPQRSLSRLCVE